LINTLKQIVKPSGIKNKVDEHLELENKAFKRVEDGKVKLKMGRGLRKKSKNHFFYFDLKSLLNCKKKKGIFILKEN
jgi:hypothetical protein